MADWRQIQARIRKAKNSPEAVSKLSELFNRTRDGMVAWELAAIEEKADHKQEAGNWYIIAAQRFRRADWKKKAEEALTRLGVPLPETKASESRSQESAEEIAVSENSEDSMQAPDSESEEETHSAADQPVSQASSASSASTEESAHRKRRRGRRGGRGRRRKGAPSLPTQAFAESASPAVTSKSEFASTPVVERRAADRVETEPASPEHLRPSRAELPPPQLPSERVAHGRTEPGVASRMAHLESLLRRLLSSPLRKLDAADEAPAGPGVFLLSDSDQTTSYYVEACQTLRVGIGNCVRGGRFGAGKGGRSGGHGSDASLKSKLAEHLEINEAKVSQYMKDHCVIRWIQLDDDAPLLAHFAVAVLRTPLNLD